MRQPPLPVVFLGSIFRVTFLPLLPFHTLTAFPVCASLPASVWAVMPHAVYLVDVPVIIPTLAVSRAAAVVNAFVTVIGMAWMQYYFCHIINPLSHFVFPSPSCQPLFISLFFRLTTAFKPYYPYPRTGCPSIQILLPPGDCGIPYCNKFIPCLHICIFRIIK